MTYRPMIFEPGWHFDSDSAPGALDLYVGGHYRFGATPNNFAAGQFFGNANSPYGDHAFIVLGAQTVDQLTIQVTGTSWDDTTGRSAADSENLVLGNGWPVNTYLETVKKWTGIIRYIVTDGTAKSCNYGGVKYWDYGNSQFFFAGWDLTGECRTTDANADFSIYHHKATGWTYNAAAPPTPPTPIANYQTDMAPEDTATAGDPLAWKKLITAVKIDGHLSEGLITMAHQSVARPFVNCNMLYRIRGNR